MVTLQLGGSAEITIIAVMIVIVVIAIILAVMYRLGYFRGRRREDYSEGGVGQFTSAAEPLPRQQRANTSQYPSESREVPTGQGGRVLLIESRPVEVKPLQRPERSVDMERIEKLIRGLENELVQVLKQTSAETADQILSRIGELKNSIDQLMKQCSSQSPSFIQLGYVPSSIPEFKDLFRASFVALFKNGDMLEYTGDTNISDEVIRSLLNYDSDFIVLYLENEYAYLIKYNDYSLILTTNEYLDPISSGFAKLLFRRFIDEVFKSQS